MPTLTPEEILGRMKTETGVEISLFTNDNFTLEDFLSKNSLKTPLKNQPQNLEEFSESPAVIYILDENKNIKFLTNKFYLVGINRSMQERTQIVETFGGEEYIFFGEKAKVYTFTGYLLETGSSDSNNKYEYMWETSLLDLYNKVMRGSMLAEKKYEAALQFKNTILYGYVLSLNLINDANNPHHTSFSFNMVIRKQTNIETNSEKLYSRLTNIPEKLITDKTKYDEALKKIKKEYEDNNPTNSSEVFETLETKIGNEEDPVFAAHDVWISIGISYPNTKFNNILELAKAMYNCKKTDDEIKALLFGGHQTNE